MALRKTKPGPKPGAPNAGRPKGTTKPNARVVLSCRVLPATLAKLRKAGPHLGRAVDTMANDKLSGRAGEV